MMKRCFVRTVAVTTCYLSTKIIIIFFDEKMFLDKSIDQIKDKMKEEYGDDININISEKYVYKIANSEYYAVDITSNDNDYLLRYCVKVKGRRVIEFYFSNDNVDEIDEFLDTVTTAD